MKDAEARGLSWHRSSDCESHACVEIAAAAGWVYFRDAKQPDGTVLRFSLAAWSDFRRGMKRGDFDVL